MIEVNVCKVDFTGHTCSNPKCAKDPNFNYRILGDIYHLKQDSICAIIGLSTAGYEVYCGGCIDYVYDIIRVELDRTFWPFK